MSSIFLLNIQNRPSKKIHMKRVQQIGSWHKVFIEHGPVGQYFATLYLKQTFGEKLHEKGSIKYSPGTKYLSNTVK